MHIHKMPQKNPNMFINVNKSLILQYKIINAKNLQYE